MARVIPEEAESGGGGLLEQGWSYVAASADLGVADYNSGLTTGAVTVDSSGWVEATIDSASSGSFPRANLFSGWDVPTSDSLGDPIDGSVPWLRFGVIELEIELDELVPQDCQCAIILKGDAGIPGNNGTTYAGIGVRGNGTGNIPLAHTLRGVTHYDEDGTPDANIRHVELLIGCNSSNGVTSVFGIGAVAAVARASFNTETISRGGFNIPVNINYNPTEMMIGVSTRVAIGSNQLVRFRPRWRIIPASARNPR